MFLQFATFGALILAVGVLFLLAPGLPLEGTRIVSPHARRTVVEARVAGAFFVLVGAAVIGLGFTVANPLPAELHLPALGIVAALFVLLVGALCARFSADISRVGTEITRPFAGAAYTATWMSAMRVRAIGLAMLVMGIGIACAGIVGAVLA